MTVIEQINQELTSLAPDKVQDCEALSHRLKELTAKVLVVGYKSGFQDASSLIMSYAEGHFKGNKDFNKEAEEVATEKIMSLELGEPTEGERPADAT